MTEAVRDVELLSKPTDWWVLRKTRLRALRDAPDAFASTYRIESAWPPGRLAGPVRRGDLGGRARRGRRADRSRRPAVATDRGPARGVGLGRGEPPRAGHAPVPDGGAGRRGPLGRCADAEAVGAEGQRRRPGRLPEAGVHRDRRGAGAPRRGG